MNTTLESNIALWQERIGNASAKWGGAEICAVTKTVVCLLVKSACWQRLVRFWSASWRWHSRSMIKRLTP